MKGNRRTEAELGTPSSIRIGAAKSSAARPVGFVRLCLSISIRFVRPNKWNFRNNPLMLASAIYFDKSKSSDGQLKEEEEEEEEEEED